MFRPTRTPDVGRRSDDRGRGSEVPGVDDDQEIVVEKGPTSRSDSLLGRGTDGRPGRRSVSVALYFGVYEERAESVM